MILTRTSLNRFPLFSQSASLDISITVDTSVFGEKACYRVPISVNFQALF
jgi:hypothetical protein